MRRDAGRFYSSPGNGATALGEHLDEQRDGQSDDVEEVALDARDRARRPTPGSRTPRRGRATRRARRSRRSPGRRAGGSARPSRHARCAHRTRRAASVPRSRGARGPPGARASAPPRPRRRACRAPDRRRARSCRRRARSPRRRAQPSGPSRRCAPRPARGARAAAAFSSYDGSATRNARPSCVRIARRCGERDARTRLTRLRAGARRRRSRAGARGLRSRASPTRARCSR